MEREIAEVLVKTYIEDIRVAMEKIELVTDRFSSNRMEVAVSEAIDHINKAIDTMQRGM